VYTGMILDKGFALPDELVALSCINDKFDSGNPEHVKKAHAWEKKLLNTPEFQQLLLR